MSHKMQVEDRFESIMDMLDEYTVAELKPFIFKTGVWQFLVDNMHTIHGLPVSVSALIRGVEPKRASKLDMVRGLAACFLDSIFFQGMLDRLPEMRRDLWVATTVRSAIVLSESEYADIVVNMPTAQGRYWHTRRRLEVVPGCQLFYAESVYDDEGDSAAISVLLSLRTSLRKLVSNLLPELQAPTNIRPLENEQIKALEDSPGLQSWEGDKQLPFVMELAQWLPSSPAYLRAGTKVDAISVTSVKKFFGPKDFWPTRKGDPSRRAISFIASTLLAMGHTSSMPPDVLLAKLIPQGVAALTHYMHTLPHITINTYHCVHNPRYLEEIVQALSYLELDNWYDVDALLLALEARVSLPLPLYSSRYLSNSVKLKKAPGLYSAALEKGDYSYVQFISRPSFRGMCMLLASLGVLDLRYADTVDSFGDEFIGLKAIRINKLGAFMLGRSNDFQVSEIDRGITISESDLIVTLSKEVERYVDVLSRFTIPLSRSQYLVTRQALLSGVTNRKELNNRLDTLKRLLGNKLPPRWITFFESFSGIAQPFTVKPDYMVLELSENADLRQLVNTSPDIRRRVRRAEGGMLLVEKSDYNKIVSILAEHGYVA